LVPAVWHSISAGDLCGPVPELENRGPELADNDVRKGT
jgi:hypothetical protein